MADAELTDTSTSARNKWVCVSRLEAEYRPVTPAIWAVMTIPKATDIEIDPEILPWSCRGSYLCCAVHAGQNGSLTTGHDVCLVSHNHSAGLPLFAIRPLVDGSASLPPGFPMTPCEGVSFSATPTVMKWVCDGKTIAEAVFASPTAIRFRGTKPLSFSTEGSLKVDAWRCWLFEVPSARPGSIAEFTSTPDTALRFACSRGRLELEGQAPFDPIFKDNNRRIIVRPEKDGEWEMEITECQQHTNTGDDRSTAFADLVDLRTAEFGQYYRTLCPWSRLSEKEDKQSDADRLASYVMWASTVAPRRFIQTEAVLMSKLWMNKVWSWDNCFNGLALVCQSIDRALEQILLPFQYITPQGRLPDSVTTSEILFDYTKPPIYGWTFSKLLQLLRPASSDDSQSFGSLSKEHLLDIYDKVSAFTRYWLNHRRTPVSELPFYAHGNDSGWDNSTAFDKQTVCVAPDLAAFMIVQCDFLARLAGYLGKCDDTASGWSHHRDRMVSALLSELWSEEHQQFMFKDALHGSTWTSTSLLRLIPLVAHRHLPKSIVDKMVLSLRAHLTEWGLATEEVSSNLYEPDGYWRGPIWAPPTIMIESSVREAGHTELADEVRDKLFALCAQSGFAENYNALTGAGNRDLSYTWSASAYLVMRKEAMST